MAKRGQRNGPAVRTDGVYDAFVCTPDDANDITDAPCRGIYVGTAGHVKVTLAGGNTVTLKNLAAGMWHAMLITRVWAASLTAADIFLGY
jgi:hypothetical protein